MLKTLVPLGAAALAAGALAMAVPVTAHAAPTGTTGPCSGAGTGSPVQHTGNGKHSFTDSHNNCVNFAGTNDTAFLDGSDFNLINMNGNNDTVHDFKNSNSNTITFQPGANFDTLSAGNSNGNTVTFNTNSINDVIQLVGLTNDTVTITGSGLFAQVVDPNAGGNTCDVNAGNAGTGTSTNPAVVIC